MNANIFDHLANVLGRDPGRPVLRWPGGAVSAGRLLERANRAAAHLGAIGIAPGDRVAVQVEKSPEAVALYLGALQAGAIYLPLNTGYTLAELDYFIADAEPRLIVCDPARAEGLKPRAGAAGARLLTLDAAGGGSLAAALDATSPETAVARRAPDDIAALLYTSGTTGRPKGAMLSHDNLWSNATTLIEAWGYSADDVLIHALPLFHTHGLFVALNMTLAAGASLHLLPRFEAQTVLALMREASVLMGVPTFYVRLLAEPGLDRAATAGMRLFVSGSAPLQAETHRAFAERTGHQILERYGMTETGMNASNPLQGERRPGSVGKALPGISIRIADPDGQPLPAGEIGGIEVRGPNVFKGYWRMPDKTAEAFRADGYFITGDLGVLDAEGYLTIVGRAKDLIISGGYNVYPKEVEDVLAALPGVAEAAVIGVPHPDFGEAVVAVLVADPAGPRADEAVLAAALGERLAPYKRPKRLLWVPALPRNTMGKVEKASLRAEHAGLFGHGPGGPSGAASPGRDRRG